MLIFIDIMHFINNYSIIFLLIYTNYFRFFNFRTVHLRHIPCIFVHQPLHNDF